MNTDRISSLHSQQYTYDIPPNDTYLSPSLYGSPLEHERSDSYRALPSIGASESTAWPRFWGGLKAVGGALETIAGVTAGAVTAWTGVGAVAGGAVALHGLDTTVAGLRQVFTGKEIPTLTSRGIAAATGSDTAGELVDAGLGIVATGGAGALSGLARGEKLAAKTLEWTNHLPPGSGYTTTFGSMVLSKLGTEIDKAQVLVHEKVHSALSLGQENFLPCIRASMSRFMYAKSAVMRYSEEAIAETAAQLATRGQTGATFFEALKTGLSFPLTNGYVRGIPLTVEAGALGAKLAATEYQVEGAFQDLK